MKKPRTAKSGAVPMTRKPSVGRRRRCARHRVVHSVSKLVIHNQAATSLSDGAVGLRQHITRPEEPDEQVTDLLKQRLGWHSYPLG